jgi:hypothetical protein
MVLHSKFVRGLNYFVLIISLALIGCLVFKDLNWVLGDDYQFLTTTMIGKPSHSWLGRGRFWPLGLWDYSILLLLPKTIGQTIEAHFAYNMITMSIAVFTLYHLFNKIDEKNYGLSLFFVLILFCVSSFLQIHMSCIYTERMMFLMQVLFMYFWLKGYQKSSTGFYLLSWIFCTYLIFSKEPVFGAVLVIALVNLIFGWNQLTVKDRSFHFSLLFSAITYLGIYVYKWFFKNLGENLYGGGKLLFSQGVDSLNTIKTIFVGEPILGLVFLFALIRAYFVFVKSDRRTLFIDSLLFGAAAYAIAYMTLGETDSFVLFPSLVFAFPSFVFWTDYLWTEKKCFSFLAVLLCGGTACLSFNISKDTVENAYKQRNNDVKVVNFLSDSYINGKYIYFFTNGRPFNDEVRICELDTYNSFINYALKKKNYLREKNVLRPLEKLEYIFDDSIVICPAGIDQKYRDYLANRGFKLIHSVFNTEIYGQ